MTPHESDPNGANSGGGAARIEDDGDARAAGSEARPQDLSESATPGVDTTERQTITSGIAQTSEIADRDAQEAAEGQGDGTPQHR
jgi:hypothetical protein